MIYNSTPAANQHPGANRVVRGASLQRAAHQTFFETTLCKTALSNVDRPRRASGAHIGLQLLPFAYLVWLRDRALLLPVPRHLLRYSCAANDVCHQLAKFDLLEHRHDLLDRKSLLLQAKLSFPLVQFLRKTQITFGPRFLNRIIASTRSTSSRIAWSPNLAQIPMFENSSALGCAFRRRGYWGRNWTSRCSLGTRAAKQRGAGLRAGSSWQAAVNRR